MKEPTTRRIAVRLKTPTDTREVALTADAFEVLLAQTARGC